MGEGRRGGGSQWGCMSQTRERSPVTRVRREGAAVVITIPASVARELALKPGDLMAVRGDGGALVAVKLTVCWSEVSGYGTRRDCGVSG